jgi:LysM repeat protein
VIAPAGGIIEGVSSRTPARVLAPLALVGVSVALYVVVKQGTESIRGDTPARVVPTTSATKPGTKAQSRRKKARRYRVRSGDTVSGIAVKTGVSVEKLMDLNPDLDPQSLSPGERLKLR